MAVRTIDVRERVMAQNDILADKVRQLLAEHDITAFNLVSSPGSGKTALLERTLERIRQPERIGLIAGDVQTQNDADRLAAHTNQLVHAVLTGGACHMDALQVLTALERMDLNQVSLLIIENVGNLVCPASWDLGETAKIVLFSVTEGEDKPLKYPKMFQKAEYVVLTKQDLLPYVPFDVNRATAAAREINPNLMWIFTSALDGSGIDSWVEFLELHMHEVPVG